MSEPAASHIAPEFAAPPEPDRSGVRIVFFTALFFTAQFALIFSLGLKKQTVPRIMADVPHFTLVAATDELIALGNPTLFALPHAHDFSAKTWTRIPSPVPPDFRWQEPPRWLGLDPKNLGAVLKDYLQTNAAAETPLDFKAAPQTEPQEITPEVFFPRQSALQIGGALADRKLPGPVTVPTLVLNEVIAPSRVQLLVAPDGSVFSVVLLESCGYADIIKPDLLALQLAREAHFAPADKMMFGEMLFKWHTEPVATTNLLEVK